MLRQPLRGYAWRGIHYASKARANNRALYKYDDGHNGEWGARAELGAP